MTVACSQFISIKTNYTKHSQNPTYKPIILIYWHCKMLFLTVFKRLGSPNIEKAWIIICANVNQHSKHEMISREFVKITGDWVVLFNTFEMSRRHGRMHYCLRIVFMTLTDGVKPGGLNFLFLHRNVRY